MQDEFSCTPATMRALETALSTPRLRRYAPAACDDPNLTLRLYIWNARLREAFYLPRQIAEVTCRNTIITALRERYGTYWYAQERFVSTLPNRLRDELNRVAVRARLEKDPSHIADYVKVSGLDIRFLAASDDQMIRFHALEGWHRRLLPCIPPAVHYEQISIAASTRFVCSATGSRITRRSSISARWRSITTSSS